MATLFQISTHRLVRLHDIKTLREKIVQQCKRSGVKGDVLLSTGGFRLHIFGEQSQLENVLKDLEERVGLEKSSYHFVELGYLPSSRIRVRIRKEIVFDETGPFLFKANLAEDKDSQRCLDDTAKKTAGMAKRNENVEGLLAVRHRSIQQHTTPLPGSTPYDNHRPIRVPPACDGHTLLDFLCEVLSHIPRDEWLQRIEAGLIVDAEHREKMNTVRVRQGERYFHRYPDTIEPDVSAKIRILYEDDAIVVVDKPAPLPLHPSGRFNRNTLQWILQHVYHPEKLRPAHRLDANTTGIIVFSRNKAMAGQLQKQFENGSVQKTYLAKVIVHPADDDFHCDVPIRKKTGPIGNRDIDPHDGLSALTAFSVLQRNDDGTSLVQAVPHTGRTNQIRVHLWALGMPICGDPVYLPSQKLGETQTLSVEAAPLCLHAWKLGFRHPENHEPQLFVAPPPEWTAVGWGAP